MYYIYFLILDLIKHLFVLTFISIVINSISLTLISVTYLLYLPAVVEFFRLLYLLDDLRSFSPVLVQLCNILYLNIDLIDVLDLNRMIFFEPLTNRCGIVGSWGFRRACLVRGWRVWWGRWDIVRHRFIWGFRYHCRRGRRRWVW